MTDWMSMVSGLWRASASTLFLLLLLSSSACYDSLDGVLDDDDTSDDDDSSIDDDDASDDDDNDGPCSDDPGSESVPANDECRVDIPLDEDPDLQILWQFSDFPTDPCSREVMMTPLVVPLTDDDGNGVPSSGDQRTILFTTFCEADYANNGRLRALRGDGSGLLWSVLDEGWAIQPDSALAAGDLDGDGWPEIVAVHEDGRLMAFDRFGQGLWQSATNVPAGTERGGAFLADLDGDGAVEIIYGKQIYNATGQLLGEGNHGHGSNSGRPEFPTSFAVDIDLDGIQEVVTGNALYDKEGNTLWYNGQPDGFCAVGNFDGDPEGEIAVVSSNTLRIQDTNGAVLFGPVSLPGTGAGGPPTVADFDGDGQPEVGVANLSYYSMFDTDLSLLWSNPTTDESSAITGSSAFDFDADGASSVVYSDEHDVWVWEGATGALVHQGTGHASGTHLEYPVVAQVLGSGPPQIVVPSNNLVGEGWSGITLLVDSGRAWATTGSIWNQHAFMPTHIESDMSIPLQPDVPWLVGQGFRQNEVVVVPGMAAPDLQLEPWAFCPGDDETLVRIRPVNFGVTSAPFWISLTREGETEPFASRQVADGLPGATLGAPIDFVLDPADGVPPIIATIDSTDLVRECSEDNNSLVVQ
ncbi:MAG: VCBS repeat-containing protein [Myxococcota bacterium]|nr:VCBS repeat-containing protein [Myxococcota bacterium]